jgi:hypothetical protein
MGERDRLPASVEGMDLAPHLLHQPGAEVPSFQPYYQTNSEHPHLGRRGLRTHRYTYVESREAGVPPVILHDRDRDPFEQRNAAAELPEVCRDMRQRLRTWLEHTGDPWVTVPEPPFEVSDNADEQLNKWLQRSREKWNR